MKTICKPRIIHQPEATPEYPFNVQLWYSSNGGKTFTYAGDGRFCKTIQEAEEYRAANVRNLDYDLMFGCLGNGTTVFNRSRMEYGDYKNVAHIDDCGVVAWYEKPETLPEYARQEINDHAAAQARNFKHGFVHLPKSAALDMLNEVLNIGQFITVFHEDGIAGKSIEEIYNAFIEYTCRNGKRTMPQQ